LILQSIDRRKQNLREILRDSEICCNVKRDPKAEDMTASSLEFYHCPPDCGCWRNIFDRWSM